MQAIYVCTHGKTALEMVKSAEMICGKQKNVGSTFFEVGESIEDLTTRIKVDLNKLDLTDGILFLTDIKGGTPFNTIASFLQTYADAYLLAGVNIPILIELFIKRTTEKIVFDENFLEDMKNSISKFEIIDANEEEF